MIGRRHKPAGLLVAVVVAATAALAGCSQPKPAAVNGQVRVWAFGASWCGPCHRDAPRRAELAKRVTVLYIDVDNDPSGSAQQFAITELPTYLVFSNGADGWRMRYRTNNINEVFAYLKVR